MTNRQKYKFLFFILFIVIFYCILETYWVVIDQYKLEEPTIYIIKSKNLTDENQQSLSYLESPISLFTPNPMTKEWSKSPQTHIEWYFKDGTIKPTKDRMFPRFRTKNSRIWPKEQNIGDRIEEQLMFVPPYYQYDKSSMKTILLYNNINEWLINTGQTEFLFNDCPVNRCTITTDKSQASNVDAILFRNKFSQPDHQKNYRQIWILFVHESAYYTEFDKNYNNIFNWTATYRHDSDIVIPYERWAYYDPVVTQVEKFDQNYAQNKTKHVAMFISDCKTDIDKLLYAKELGNYISVDIYGECEEFEKIELDIFLKKLDQDYKFYLTFDNTSCIDYVTDKFFVNGLQHKVLPIVLGGRQDNYERMAPKKSYLHVDDFESTERLAAYLNRLDVDDGLYNEYFRWKDTGEFIDTKFVCRLCAMLHDDGAPSKYYQNFDIWWHGPGVCDMHEETPLAQPPKTSKNHEKDRMPLYKSDEQID